MTVFVIALTLSACTREAAEPHDGHEEHDDHKAEHSDHEAQHIETVTLTPQAVIAARIKVEPVETGGLSGALGLPGRLILDPRKEALVSAWISGQVEGLSVRPGDVVKKGQTLATVQSPELGGAVGAFRTAKAKDEAADARLERLKRLEADGVSSRAQVLEAEAEHAEALGSLEAAEERLRVLGVDPNVGDPHKGAHFPSRVPVKSPIAGKVLSTDASVGERVEPGRTLFHIGDLDQLWLMLDVYERDLPTVQKGQSVRFNVDAWPESSFEGTVEQVGDWVEPDARTVEVRVVVDNADHRLKPNMFAKAEVATAAETQTQGIIVPASGVQRLDDRDVVFVEEKAGHYEAREVVVAESGWSAVRLSSGIAVGDRVVTEGAFALKSELEKGELGDGHAH